MCQDQKLAQRSFRGGYPADILGSFARSSRAKASGPSPPPPLYARKPCFLCAEKSKKYLTEPNVPVDHFRNKMDQTFFLGNVARNSLICKVAFFLRPKSVPFCCKNANLPNRACFTRIPPSPREVFPIILLSYRTPRNRQRQDSRINFPAYSPLPRVYPTRPPKT